LTDAALRWNAHLQPLALRRSNGATRQSERLLTNVAVLADEETVADRHGVILHNEKRKSVLRHRFFAG
jgi:hypothetical protein